MGWKVWGSVQGVDRGVRNPIHTVEGWSGVEGLGICSRCKQRGDQSYT